MDLKTIMVNISIENIDMFGYKRIEYDNKIEYSFMRNEMLQWITKNYIKFNTLYFDNMLPPIDDKQRIVFEVVNSKKIKALGLAYPTLPYRIKINFRYDLPEIEWLNVLLHEMVHIWQFIMGYKGNHDKTFYKKANEINKYGWKIKTYYNTNILNKLEDVR